MKYFDFYILHPKFFVSVKMVKKFDSSKNSLLRLNSKWILSETKSSIQNLTTEKLTFGIDDAIWKNWLIISEFDVYFSTWMP